MPTQRMEDLANIMAQNPGMMKAALAGMQEGIEREAKKQGLELDPGLIASLGKVKAAPGNGGGISPVADDYVARGVSSVLAVVKVKPTDLLTHAAESIREIQNMKIK